MAQPDVEGSRPLSEFIERASSANRDAGLSNADY